MRLVVSRSVIRATLLIALLFLSGCNPLIFLVEDPTQPFAARSLLGAAQGRVVIVDAAGPPGLVQLVPFFPYMVTTTRLLVVDPSNGSIESVMPAVDYFNERSTSDGRYIVSTDRSHGAINVQDLVSGQA